MSDNIILQQVNKTKKITCIKWCIVDELNSKQNKTFFKKNHICCVFDILLVINEYISRIFLIVTEISKHCQETESM